MKRFLRLKIDYLLFSIPLIAFFIVLLLPLIHKTIKAPVRSDAIGYYSYLPAIFNKKDLTFKYMISEKYSNNKGENSYEEKFSPKEAQQTGFHYFPNTQKYLDKYPIGEAILLLPFFIVVHILTILYGFDQSGYSYFYQYSCVVGGVTYLILGIYLIRKFLENYFNKAISLLASLILLFTTNLLNYSTYENLFSHVYSFFLIALFLNNIRRWFNQKNIINSIILGINISLIILLRQVNILFLALFFLYGISSKKDFFANIKTFFRNYKLLLIMALSSLVVFSPQILYWKYSTNSFLIYSYKDEGFSLQNTHFLDSLFSITRGLFAWSPILVIGLIGIFLLKNKIKKYRTGIIISLILQWIIVSTWSSWTFGWGYGHRIFVDSLPLFSIGIGSFLEYIYNLKNKHKKILYLIIGISFILLSFFNIFQTTQYWLRILPPEIKTLDEYKKVFLQINQSLINKWNKEV